MDKKLLVLDVDTGVDDALAIILAFRSAAAEVLAIGSVVGNIEADQAAINTLKVLDALGADVPVAVGLEKPLLGEPSTVPFIHGNDGMGDADLPAPTRQPTGEHAVDQLIRLAHERPGEITLFACGPLTNVAAALIRDPELPRLIKDLVIMGGAFDPIGNVTPMAEANIWHDPEAARLVLQGDWPITMVGLDVTMRAFLRRHHLEQLQAAPGRVAQFVAAIVPFYWNEYTRTLGSDGCALHDPLALAIALDPGLVTRSAQLDVRVETQSPLTLGMTVADRRVLLGPGYPAPSGPGYERSQRPVTVPLAVDNERFVQRLMDAFLS